MTATAANRAARRAGGITLVEVVIATAVVGLLFVAAMNSVGASRMSQRRALDRARGFALAQELAFEILAKEYADPNGTGALGPDGGEAASRAAFDDVDDYDGWSASPPEEPDGTAIAELSGWTRQAAVEWVQVDDVSQTSAMETGLKRVVVRVRHTGDLVAELTALRTERPE